MSNQGLGLVGRFATEDAVLFRRLLLRGTGGGGVGVVVILSLIVDRPLELPADTRIF